MIKFIISKPILGSFRKVSNSIQAVHMIPYPIKCIIVMPYTPLFICSEVHRSIKYACIYYIRRCGISSCLYKKSLPMRCWTFYQHRMYCFLSFELSWNGRSINCLSSVQSSSIKYFQAEHLFHLWDNTYIYIIKLEFNLN